MPTAQIEADVLFFTGAELEQYAAKRPKSSPGQKSFFDDDNASAAPAPKHPAPVAAPSGGKQWGPEQERVHPRGHEGNKGQWAKRPFGDVDASEAGESKHFGAKIRVHDERGREEPHAGTVRRVLNGGDVVEYHPDNTGHDPAATFRVSGHRVEVLEHALKREEPKAAPEKPAAKPPESPPATPQPESSVVGSDQPQAKAIQGDKPSGEFNASLAKTAPHMMSKAEFQDAKWKEKTDNPASYSPTGVPHVTEAFTRKQAEKEHRQAVQKALDAGATVPDEVLADYPDLKPSHVNGDKPAPDKPFSLENPKPSSTPKAEPIEGHGKEQQQGLFQKSGLAGQKSLFQTGAVPDDLLPEYAKRFRDRS